MTKQRTSPTLRTVLVAGAAFVLVAAMALDTKVVRNGAPGAPQPGVFSAASYGETQFPKVRDAIIAKAVDATVLADALKKDPDAAQKQYAVVTDGAAEYCVRFTGIAGKKDDDSGTVPFKIDGIGDTPKISVQTGPAIMGTDLRDATGKIQFGQFSNQIDYQNAGAALNTAMKKAVLAKLGDTDLAGKTVTVVGVFQLSDPGTWTVTPVEMDVK
ncbi:DUF2291 domain-containing protein [Acetobacteraceae bacterium KSS8]|uniref:DUF2291 domain-containing protein n=1 Tax=Endosaccharibacter trunci TaxID=2812733 RepID=A0ABT1W3Z5_9PROT|nr:DUF2291 domain-containing protein [Acetobacteraceae bacterium KSS8]